MDIIKAGSWPLPLLFLLLGILVGGAVNAAVAEYRLWRQQKATSKALLEHTKVCCATAKRVSDSIRQMIPDWENPPVKQTYNPDSLDTTFWDSALQNLAHLPPEHLPSLIRFYARVKTINARLEALEQGQIKYANLKSRTTAEESLKGSRRDVLGTAKKIMFMCDELANYREITDLSQLPMEFKTPDHVPPELRGPLKATEVPEQP